SKARLDQSGELMVLEEQDRTKWDEKQIAEALLLVDEALRGEVGPYTLQAAISAEHCKAANADSTNWSQIVRLYDLLQGIQRSPVILLNRAVAVAMRDGPSSGLSLVDELSAAGELKYYHLLYATRADLLRRLGNREQAAESYRRALELVTNETERKFLQRRLAEVS